MLCLSKQEKAKNVHPLVTVKCQFVCQFVQYNSDKFFYLIFRQICPHSDGSISMKFMACCKHFLHDHQFSSVWFLMTTQILCNSQHLHRSVLTFNCADYLSLAILPGYSHYSRLNITRPYNTVQHMQVWHCRPLVFHIIYVCLLLCSNIFIHMYVVIHWSYIVILIYSFE